MQSLWAIAVIGGPILFLIAIIWATIRNRQQSTPQSEALTERATKEQREEQAAENHKINGPLG